MKILYVIPVMFMLSGCLYQDVPKFIISKSEEICADHEGIWEITSFFEGTYVVKCNDAFATNVKTIRRL